MYLLNCQKIVTPMYFVYRDIITTVLTQNTYLFKHIYLISVIVEKHLKNIFTRRGINPNICLLHNNYKHNFYTDNKRDVAIQNMLFKLILPGGARH